MRLKWQNCAYLSGIAENEKGRTTTDENN